MGKLGSDALPRAPAPRPCRRHACGLPRVAVPHARDRAGAVRRGVRAAGRGNREAAVAPAHARGSDGPADSDGARPDPGARARDRRWARGRSPRVPHAVELHARLRRQPRRRMGGAPRDTVVDARDPARDRSRGNLVRDRLRGRRLRGRVRSRAEPVDSLLPPHGAPRRGRAGELDQGAPPPGAADVQSDRRDARPLVPERPLGDRGGVLRRRCARRWHGAAARGLGRCSPVPRSRSRSASPRVASCSASTGSRTSWPASPSDGAGSRSARSRSAAGS